ncbi:MAG TPA: hypothetical protein PKA77_09910 [Chitinophagaceae bacterium]|jgi:hypothetical protein|nr:hypothetical protein [Chitinophagaceae bacterium]HMU58932.1 hypothetical protein [Chitinophagaceae bacterium]
MEKETFTRNELYDLVWSVPLLTLSKKYAISDVGLRKICIKMEIPLPKAGHWQKLQFNKKTNQPKLSANYNGDKEVILSLRTEEMKNIAASPSPSKILQQQIEKEMQPTLSVPEKLSKPDELIIAARESLNRKDRYEHNGMVSCERGELDIRVARTNIPRALRFMDTLIKAVKARGHDVIIENDSTNILINTQKLKVSLREKTRRVPGNDHWQTYDYIPTGILIFKLDKVLYDKEWIDGKQKLEDQLPAILAKLEIISVELNEWDRKRKQEREEEQIRRDRQKEFEKRQEEELKLFRSTLLKSSRWHKAVNLRNYIDEVEAKAKAENKLNDELQSWLAWARGKADWYDPFTETPDELLQDIDRETLEPIKKPYSYSW